MSFELLVDLLDLGVAAAYLSPFGFIPAVLKAGRPTFLGATTGDPD